LPSTLSIRRSYDAYSTIPRAEGSDRGNAYVSAYWGAPPGTPQDLLAHNCINLRLPTYGGFLAWEFEKGGRRSIWLSLASLKSYQIV